MVLGTTANKSIGPHQGLDDGLDSTRQISGHESSFMMIPFIVFMRVAAYGQGVPVWVMGVPGPGSPLIAFVI